MWLANSPCKMFTHSFWTKAFPACIFGVKIVGECDHRGAFTSMASRWMQPSLTQHCVGIKAIIRDISIHLFRRHFAVSSKFSLQHLSLPLLPRSISVFSRFSSCSLFLTSAHLLPSLPSLSASPSSLTLLQCINIRHINISSPLPSSILPSLSLCFYHRWFSPLLLLSFPHLHHVSYSPCHFHSILNFHSYFVLPTWNFTPLCFPSTRSLHNAYDHHH